VPNVLFILTDDQGPWALGCSGNEEMRTPNLDRLAESGLRFEHFFCTSPVCSPARASLFTGRIPSQHGVHDWLKNGNADVEGDRAIPYLEGQLCYTDLLAEAGYNCAFTGKWHLGDSARPRKGFSHWRVHVRGGGPYYEAPMLWRGLLYHEPRYLTDAITEDALSCLDELAAGDRPFHLSVHYTAPHSPWDRDNHPSDLYDSFESCPFLSCPDLPSHPWKNPATPSGQGEERRKVLQGYFAAVTAMDAGVGKLLDRLDSLGLGEDTLVVFMSDNGMNMGHHGIYGKGNGTFPLNMYDTSVHVPAIISRPGSVPQGVVRDRLYSQYDFFPTLMDYLDCACPDLSHLPGRSFAPLLRSQPVEESPPVVVMDEYGPVRMIRDMEWKYVHRYPYGPNELYDLGRDPQEENNLAEERKHRALLEEMRARLQEWFLRYAEAERNGATLPVTGKGQVDWVGTLGEGRRAFETP